MNNLGKHFIFFDGTRLVMLLEVEFLGYDALDIDPKQSLSSSFCRLIMIRPY